MRIKSIHASAAASKESNNIDEIGSADTSSTHVVDDLDVRLTPTYHTDTATLGAEARAPDDPHESNRFEG